MNLEGPIFVLGKGGVGKTTLAVGLATLAVERGLRTLLVRLGESLDETQAKSRAPSRSGQGYDVVDLEPRHAMDEYVRKVVRVGPLAERVISSDVYRKFFAAAPGLPELVLLGRMRAFAKEQTRGGTTRWQCMIVDCPSSGHGLLMLETPFAAYRAVPIGPFARLASQIIDWLRTEVRVALVAIPEEMAVVEAVELADELHQRIGLKPSFVFLNRVRRENLSAAARQAISSADRAPGPLDRVLIQCATRVQRRARLEAFHRKRLTKGLGRSAIAVGEAHKGRPAAIVADLRSVFEADA